MMIRMVRVKRTVITEGVWQLGCCFTDRLSGC